MAKPFRRLTEELPAERRERIEARKQALIQEYELLKALRQDRDVSQAQLAELMGIRQASISKIENQDDMRLSTLRKYVEALGGELEIRVHFPDSDVSLDPFPHQQGLTPMDEANLRRQLSDDEAWVRDTVSQMVGPDEAEAWLRKPNRHLDDRSLLKLLRSGEGGQVRNYITALLDSNFH